MSDGHSTAEEWRDIPGYTGYQASSLGRIRSLFYHQPFLKAPQRNRRGYPSVRLKVNGKYTQRKIAVLVLLAFVGLRPAKGVARHLDDNVDNNCLSNLSWGTQKENMADAFRNGRMKPARGSQASNAKLTEDDVRGIRKARKEGETLCALGARYGVSYTVIGSICLRKTWKHVE